MPRSRHRTRHRVSLLISYFCLFPAWNHRSVEAGSNTSGKSRAATSRDRALQHVLRDLESRCVAHNLVSAGCQSRQYRGTMRNVRPSCPWHAVATPRVRHARAYTLLMEFLPAVAAVRHEIRSNSFVFFHVPDCRMLVTRHTGNRTLRARRLLVDSDNVMHGMHVRNVRRSNLSASSAARVSLWYVAWAVYQRGPRWRRLLPARWKTLREAGIPGLIIGFVNFRCKRSRANTGIRTESVTVIKWNFRGKPYSI